MSREKMEMHICLLTRSIVLARKRSGDAFAVMSDDAVKIAGSAVFYRSNTFGKLMCNWF